MEPFETLSNILQKESAYFLRYLQLKFLEGGGCAMFQIGEKFFNFNENLAPSAAGTCI
jgi:hypothetical protein